jgi:alpha-amylase/alpha-mannosidase (GH57 family)
MTRFLCVHGHYYQPPRENPWLELIEVQDSAHPYHDWNERINRECYAPNTVSRLLDGGGRIRKIVNNFERISFNVGPTLFSWLAENDPDTHDRIVAADRASMERLSGHGNAIAQVYNHMIMPLASERDRQTQIKWGIADFIHRFGRPPEGMWLAETAADTATLDDLAHNGVLFTILAQSQAREVKEPGATDYAPVHGVDPTRPYLAELPSGRSIAVFFYDGPISQAVAFEGLLSSGDKFAQRLTNGFSDARSWPQLLSIATDGETFGHHHRFGEMALSAAMESFDTSGEAVVTNYAAHLAAHPPTAKVRIHNGSAWSCAHGVERWRSDCGCNIGSGAGWNQKWRTPLREGLDFLKTIFDQVFETEGKTLFADPWEARNRYIDVILDRSRADAFLEKQMIVPAVGADRAKAMRLLEMQRNGMLMFTSCGWFFDDISGIETIQILKYAARAIQLLEAVCDRRPEDAFLDILGTARSNIPTMGDGRAVWRKFVAPERADLARVAANYAIAATLSPTLETGLRFYDVTEGKRASEEYGGNGLTLLTIRAKSRIIGEDRSFLTACLRLGRTDVTAFVADAVSADEFESVRDEILGAWRNRPVTDLIRALDRRFSGAGGSFLLKDLFVEARRVAVSYLASDHIHRFSDAYRTLFSENRRVMEYFIDCGVPIPGEFKLAAQYIMEQELLQAAHGLENNGDLERIVDLMGDVHRWGLAVNLTAVRELIETRMADMVGAALTKRDRAPLAGVVRALLGLHSCELTIDLWRLQNLFAVAYFGRTLGDREPFFGDRALKKLGIMLNFSYREDRDA